MPHAEKWERISLIYDAAKQVLALLVRRIQLWVNKLVPFSS